MALKFFWNGVKGSDGKLQRARFSEGPFLNHPAGTMTIYAKDCRFSAEVRAAFAVENHSDSRSDYFENDRIRVRPSHPLYSAVIAAYQKGRARTRQVEPCDCAACKNKTPWK
jgi:hypothetical protein